MATDDTTAQAGPRKRGRGADPAKTRASLVDAAFTSLRTRGYASTTARSIAGLADCNQAAIYYHFGSIEALLIESLAQSSARRLEDYRAQLVEVDDLAELVAAVQRLYNEDRSTGHLGVLAELTGALTSNPDLAEGIAEVADEWLGAIAEKIEEVVSTAVPQLALVPAEDIADLLLSLVLGIEVRTKIDGDTSRIDDIFAMAKLIAALAPNP